MDDAWIKSEAGLDAAIAWQRGERIRRRKARAGTLVAIALPAFSAAMYLRAWLEDRETSLLGGVALMILCGVSAYSSVVSRRTLAAAELERELESQRARTGRREE